MQHKNLASERVRLGFNQTDMAKELGVTIKHINKYENNTKIISKKNLRLPRGA